ncbi:hypothetical protein [Pandoravirus japonicus]|uniref:Uncharacterized protein n=1 Tax=Pandoravirus japonicus TaxID=2823154 RepID=A0A811BN27_9VIRU|nr:hypothetical protein [Pandoravirus japonicus]
MSCVSTTSSVRAPCWMWSPRSPTDPPPSDTHTLFSPLFSLIKNPFLFFSPFGAVVVLLALSFFFLPARGSLARCRAVPNLLDSPRGPNGCLAARSLLHDKFGPCDHQK